MDSIELEESKEEAIRALFDESQIALYALAHNISPFAVRQRLLAHIAGAEQVDPTLPYTPRVEQPVPSPLSLSVPAHHPSVANGSPVPNASLTPSSSTLLISDNLSVTPGPIYARIINPGTRRRHRNRVRP